MTQVAGVAPGASVRPARPPDLEPRRRQPLLSRIGPGWPLVVMLGGWPLWWVLGVAEPVALCLSLVMLAQLVRRPGLRLPRGFGWWALFLVWVALGVPMLWVDAPGAVPGGGSERLLVFGYKFAWYLACTVVLVWITTMPRREVPDRLVHGAVAWLFAVSTAGGLLALALPALEFASPFEMVLPRGLTSNAFVKSLVHVQAADVQSVLGEASGRPKAPFAYTNTWGSVMALSLVFLVAWLAHKRGETRWRWYAAAGLVVLAAIPSILYSLNRGLWGSLALGAVGLVVLAIAKRRARLLVGLVVLGALLGMAVVSTGLGTVVTDRLANQHSNDRRGELLVLTTTSVSQGSPVLGFGSTRDVQGSFSSITGGSTPECPACGVPPLGTQGLLWTVLFSQGWFGLAFFLIFIVLALIRSLPCRSINQVLCTFTVAFFVLQLFVYDTLGLPLMMLMIAIGLVARDRHEAVGAGPPRTLTTGARLGREVSRAVPVVAVGMTVGALIGLGLTLLSPRPPYAASVYMALTPAPVYLKVDSTVEGVASRRPKDITTDTEAALLMSEATLRPAAESVGSTPTVLRDSLTITGEPNTDVLVLNLSWPRADEMTGLSDAVIESYFAARRDYLERRREDLLGQLREQLRTLEGTGAATSETRREITSTIRELERSGGDVGEVIRADEPERGRRGFELLVTSGAALGLLGGVLLITLTPPRPRRRP